MVVVVGVVVVVAVVVAVVVVVDVAAAVAVVVCDVANQSVDESFRPRAVFTLTRRSR